MDIFHAKIVVVFALIGAVGAYTAGLLTWRKDSGEADYIAPLPLALVGATFSALLSAAIIFLVIA